MNEQRITSFTQMIWGRRWLSYWMDAKTGLHTRPSGNLAFCARRPMTLCPHLAVGLPFRSYLIVNTPIVLKRIATGKWKSVYE